MGILVFLGLVLTTAYGLLGSFYTPQRLAPLVEQALERYLPRRVVWKEMRFDPLGGFAFVGLRIGEHPGFGQGAFLSCSRLDLGVSLTGLFQGRIKVQRIELLDPSLVIIRNSGSNYNFNDLSEILKKELEPGPAPDQADRSWGIGFDLREIILRNGLAALDPGPGGRLQRIRDIRFRAVRSGLPGRFDYRLSCSLGGVDLAGRGSLDPSGPSVRMSLAASEIAARDLAGLLPRSLPLDLPRGVLSLELEFDLDQSGRIRLQGRARAVDTDLVLFRPNRTFPGILARAEFDLVREPDPEVWKLNQGFLDLDGNRADLSGAVRPNGFDLELDLASLDLAWLNRTGLLAGPRLTGSASGNLHIRKKTKDPFPQISGHLECYRVRLGRAPGVIGPLVLVTEFRGGYDPDSNKLDLASARIGLPGLATEISGWIGSQKAKLEARDLRADLARLRSLIADPSLPGLKGSLSGDLSMTGPILEPSGWKLGGEADLAGVELSIAGLKEDLTLEGKLRLQDRRILFQELKGGLGGSVLAIDGHLIPLADPPQGEIGIKCDRFDISLLEPLWSRDRGEPGPGSLLAHGPSLKGRIRIAQAARSSGLLQDLDLKYRLGRGKLLIAPLKAKTGDQGALSLNLNLSLADRNPAYQGQLRINQAGTEPLVAFLGLDRERWPRGTLDLEAAFGGHGFGAEDIRTNFTGQVSAQLSRGRFPGHPAGAALARFLGLDSFHRLEFDQWTANLEIKGSESLVRGLIRNHEYLFSYQGRVDPDGRLNLTSLLSLDLGSLDRSKATPPLLAAPRDDQGRYLLPLTIFGRGPRTGVEIDPTRLAGIRENLARTRAEKASGE